MDDYIKQALDIVKAQACVRNMTEEEINSMIKTLTQGIKGLVDQDQPQQQEQSEPPAVDPKKAIKEKSIVCLECNKSFKVLTKKHLATHGLTPEEYKEKWGYKKNASLVCKSLARERRKKMQEIRLWEKRKKS